MEPKLPVRKHPRLKDYDYRLPGYYYVTIHCAKDAPLFSIISAHSETAAVRLTPCGAILGDTLRALPQKFPNIRIDRAVIMPTHIHAIIQIRTPSEKSLTEMVGAYKSLATREVNKTFSTFGKALFQTSFYEKVIRDEYQYVEICRYIDENPLKWLLYGQ